MADRTKIWIADKMKALMAKKPLDKIRVTEICREAEIERPTFYYHFRDKYDLVAWIFVHDSVNLDVISVESAADSMNRMKQEYLFYKRAYEDKSQNELWEYMHEYFVNGYSEAAKAKLGVDALDTQMSFSIRLYCYGAVWMSREWILNDNVTSAETVVRMMFNTMPRELKELYFGKEGV